MTNLVNNYCWIEFFAMLSGQKLVRGKHVRLQDTDKTDCRHENFITQIPVLQYR
jgi:hypothetical protein